MVRVKYRYLLLEIIWSDFVTDIANQVLELPVTESGVHHALKTAISTLYGDYGIGVLQLGTTVKLVNRYCRIALVRARRGPHRLLCTVIPFIKKINNKQATLRTLHVGGTVRSVNKFLRTYLHKELVSILRKCKTDEERKKVQTAIKSSLKGLTGND